MEFETLDFSDPLFPEEDHGRKQANEKIQEIRKMPLLKVMKQLTKDNPTKSSKMASKLKTKVSKAEKGVNEDGKEREELDFGMGEEGRGVLSGLEFNQPEDYIEKTTTLIPDSKIASNTTVKIIDGEIVVEIEEGEDDGEDGGAWARGIEHKTEESEAKLRHVTAATWGHRETTERWRSDELAKLYDALRLYGLSWEQISSAIPNRSISQIKRRFNYESRINKSKVDAALSYNLTQAEQGNTLEHLKLMLEKIRKEKAEKQAIVDAATKDEEKEKNSNMSNEEKISDDNEEFKEIEERESKRIEQNEKEHSGGEEPKRKIRIIPENEEDEDDNEEEENDGEMKKVKQKRIGSKIEVMKDDIEDEKKPSSSGVKSEETKDELGIFGGWGDDMGDISVNPMNEKALYHRAQALFGRRQFSACSEDAKRLEAISPTSSKYVLLEARSLEAMGNKEGALEAYRRACFIGPDDRTAQLTGGAFMAAAGLDEEALEHVQRGLALDEDSQPCGFVSEEDTEFFVCKDLGRFVKQSKHAKKIEEMKEELEEQIRQMARSAISASTASSCARTGLCAIRVERMNKWIRRTLEGWELRRVLKEELTKPSKTIEDIERFLQRFFLTNPAATALRNKLFLKEDHLVQTL
eukprot:MONOS_10728.1-p1 / transcript=MONOS_10728.1 / gene=MONOS_10728 / organism=Monocercomonoides_exilis_PA203 / gene_product=unspecified product / transcript_product=unspecified product / location=Mono_scaffold00498:38237-41051(-) / protein_length=636 / sequence_SO=supercontig / SO=protein_coding / is_pseudo=false